MRCVRRSLRIADVVVLVLCTVLVLSSLAAVGPQGRRRAKEMVCLANLRQWHAVFQAYIADNDGSFFTGTNVMGYWWPVQLEAATQSWKKNRTWFCPTTAGPMIDEYGRSAPRFDVFTAWGVYNQGPHQLGPDGISGSYGLNGYMLNTPPGHTFEAGIKTDNNWRTPNIAGAENIPLFVDALRFDLWPLHTNGPAVSESAAWSGNHMARCCINRHEGGVNCLFADGAARKVGLKALWMLKWHRSFEMAGPWTQAGGVQAADWPAWMRDFRNY